MELKIEHLSKQFKDKTAVNDVNLTHSDFRCSVRDGLLKNIVSDAILYH